LTLVTKIFNLQAFSKAASDRADRRADGASATFADISTGHAGIRTIAGPVLVAERVLDERSWLCPLTL
jgi:hypothetical protein